MDPHLREQPERLLPPAGLDALLQRAEARAHVEREPAAVGLGRLHYFEVLARVMLPSRHLEEHVGAHAVLRRHPEPAASYAQAAEALADLYQAVGRMPAPAQEP